MRVVFYGLFVILIVGIYFVLLHRVTQFWCVEVVLLRCLSSFGGLIGVGFELDFGGFGCLVGFGGLRVCWFGLLMLFGGLSIVVLGGCVGVVGGVLGLCLYLF